MELYIFLYFIGIFLAFLFLFFTFISELKKWKRIKPDNYLKLAYSEMAGLYPLTVWFLISWIFISFGLFKIILIIKFLL